MSSSYGSIFSFAKNAQQQQAAAEEDDNYGMGPGWQAINSAPIDPNKPAFRPSPASVDPYGSGPLPDNLGNQTQRLISTGYPNTVAPIGLMPIYGGPQLNAVTHSVATQVVKEAIAAIPPTPATIVFNGVNEQTGNYTAQASDSGKLISFDITSPATLTLPATSPGDEWFTSVENNGSAMLTINPNGLELDYLTNSIALGPGQGIVLYSDGTNYFTQRGLSDGLAHGITPTETDPSSIIMFEDFLSGNTTTGSIGQLGWTLVNVGSSSFAQLGCLPPNQGVVRLNPNSGANDGLVLTPTPMVASSGSPVGFPIGYSTGWDCSFVFRWPYFSNGNSLNPFTKSRLYLGFAVHSATNDALRPAKFCGLRFDKDPGVTLTVSAAGNASSGVTNYTGTFTGGGSNAFQGFEVTIAGFTNSANNGTFICCGSNTTTLSLLNASGASESHAATATTPAISDSTYVFECVQNGIDGNNVQGSTYNTSISPDNNWHRFQMRSVVAGQVLFSIDGGTETAISISTDTFPTYSNASDTASVEVYGNYATLTGAIEVLPVGQIWFSNPAWGTPATLAGITGAAAVLNGTWPINEDSTALTDSNMILKSSVNSSASADATGITLTWYNAFYPIIQFGADSEGAVRSLDVDFFSFVYNPGFATDFNQSPDPTKARFFNGQV